MENNNKRKLSKGAIAGITVGVIVVVVLIITIVVITLPKSNAVTKSKSSPLNGSDKIKFMLQKTNNVDNTLNVIKPKEPEMKMIIFYTEGQPNDQGRDLTKQADEFQKLFENEKITIERFTPKICYELDFNKFSSIFRVYDEQFIHEDHYRGNKHGFWGWKPFIISAALQKMNDGDILFYTDCNIERYPVYKAFEKPFDKFLKQILEFVGADIFVAFEFPDVLKSKYHIKKAVFEAVGDNSDYYREYPLLNANRIIIKKTRFTEKIVREWFDLCCRKDLLLPEKTKEPELRWHTHDQAILTVLLRKKIAEEILPKDYPKIWFGNKQFDLEHMYVYSP